MGSKLDSEPDKVFLFCLLLKLPRGRRDFCCNQSEILSAGFQDFILSDFPRVFQI